MMVFRSRWDDWAPKEPISRTDKTDKSPSVSFVSSPTRPFAGENDDSDPKTDTFLPMKGSQKAPLSLTDKTDKRSLQASKLTTDKADGSLLRRAHLAVVPDLSDPKDIQTWLDERAAMREVGSGTTRVDADKLVFDELLWIWRAANPVEHAPGQCAACGTSFEPPVMSLPDGAQVCDKPDHDCLISYGNGRRMEAVKALGSLGIAPPAWWAL